MADLSAEWGKATPIPLQDEWNKAVPDKTETRPTPVNAGLGSLATSVLGLPADTLQSALNLGRMAVGTVATAAGRPDLAPDILTKKPLTSEWLKEKLRQTGMPGLSPDNPDPKSPLGTLAYDMTARGGFIPGAVLPAAASLAAEKISGDPRMGIVGAMVPSAATTAFNASRAPALATAQAQNVVRDATLKSAQDAGYVLPLSSVKPTAAGNVVESFAGKAALKQEAEIKNQQVTNKLVRDELQLPANTPLTEGTLTNLRNQASAPYREVSALSPRADKMLQALRDARSEAKDQWRHWDMQGVPEAKRQAVALDNKSEMLERLLEKEALSKGRPDLIPQLREARTYIAKTYDIERALNLGNGNIDAQIIGRALDRGRPLTGNLETIAKFAEGPGRQFTREASKVPNPGTSAFNAGAAGVLGYEGYQHFGAPGLAAAAIPFVRGGVRQGLLSDAYQSRFNRPDYVPNVQPQGKLQAILQQAIMAQQRK